MESMLLHRTIKLLALSVAFFSFSLSVSGQGFAQEDPLGFFPSIKVHGQSDDNILRAETQKLSDTIYSVSPSLLYIGLMGKHSVNLSFKGDYGFFEKNDNENYLDSAAGGRVYLDLAPELKINAGGAFLDEHEPRGSSGSRTEITTKPDQANQQQLTGEILYGRRSNIAQVSLTYGEMSRKYVNNDQESRDRGVKTAGGTLFINIGPKTSLLAEARRVNIDYLNRAAMNLDSEESSLMVGIKWEATAKTTGEIKAGYAVKALKDSSLDDFAGMGVEARLIWEPRTYSKLTLLVSRRTEETTYIGPSYYVSNRGLARLGHELSDRLWLDISMDYSEDEFSRIRKDNLFYGSLGLGYKMLRWLTAEARFKRFSRNSNLDDIDYEANVIAITLTAEALKGAPSPGRYESAL